MMMCQTNNYSVGRAEGTNVSGTAQPQQQQQPSFIIIRARNNAKAWQWTYYSYRDLVGGEATMIVMIDVTAAGVVFLWACRPNENRSLEDAPNKQEKFFVKPIEN